MKIPIGQMLLLLAVVLLLIPTLSSCNPVTTTDEGSFDLDTAALRELTVNAPAGVFEILTDAEHPRVEYRIRYGGYFSTKPYVRASKDGEDGTVIDCGAHFMIGSANFEVKIYMPQDAADVLSVNLTSGTMTLPQLTLSKLSLNIASGTVVGEELICGELDMDVASGKVTMSGKFGEIDGDAASGNVEISSAIIPVKAKMELASGAFTLRIPDENDGFVADFEKMSGSITSDFGEITGKTSGNIVYGKGVGKFNFNIMSGSVRIERLG